MSVAAWSMLWQAVVAITCVAFFTLAACIARGAVRDLLEMFRDLAEAPDDPHKK